MNATSIIYCFTYQNLFYGILSQYNDTEGVPSWTVNLKKKTRWTGQKWCEHLSKKTKTKKTTQNC